MAELKSKTITYLTCWTVAIFTHCFSASALSFSNDCILISIACRSLWSRCVANTRSAASRCSCGANTSDSLSFSFVKVVIFSCSRTSTGVQQQTNAALRNQNKAKCLTVKAKEHRSNNSHNMILTKRLCTMEHFKKIHLISYRCDMDIGDHHCPLCINL